MSSQFARLTETTDTDMYDFSKMWMPHWKINESISGVTNPTFELDDFVLQILLSIGSLSEVELYVVLIKRLFVFRELLDLVYV